MSNYAPVLATALMQQVGGHAQRSELDSISKVIRAMISYYGAWKPAFEQALFSPGFPSSRVSEEDKRVFLSKLVMLRGGRKTNEVVQQFWASCKGTVASLR